jgi:hypothetical protein
MKEDGIENTLARMRPAKPSAALMARLQAACAGAPTRPAPLPIHFRPAVAIAAGVAATGFCGWLFLRAPAGSVAQSPGTANPPAAVSRPLIEVFAPVETRNFLLDAEPAATIHLPDHPPVRVIRFLWLDDVLCRSEGGDAALEFTQAREQWVPVTSVVY